MKKLHLGCGKVYLPGWVNVDIFSNTKADAYHDITSLPYEKQSFNLIYASHVLEHVHRHMIVATLSHWRSLLSPGGVLRLAVPNFKAISDWYQNTGDLEILLGLLYGAQNYPLNKHTITFDKNYLSKLLFMAKFTHVKEWNWRTTEHADFDDYSQCYLPHLQKDTGAHCSLNLEAIR